MAYWDETSEIINAIQKKRVWRVELLGDLDGDFQFVAHIQKIRTQDGVEISQEDLGHVSVSCAEAKADPALEPQITKIKNGCRALIRELRGA